jgi:hypothetical protein
MRRCRGVDAWRARPANRFVFGIRAGLERVKICLHDNEDEGDKGVRMAVRKNEVEAIQAIAVPK